MLGDMTVYNSFSYINICQFPKKLFEHEIARPHSTNASTALRISNYARIFFLQMLIHCSSLMSRNMRFPTMLYVRPAKAQISLPMCAV